MNQTSPEFFSQLHIDIARNSTDDFNLFHDSRKWQNINGNPFNGPITLGFQLESLIEGKIADYRRQHDEEKLIAEQGLNFSNYQFTFANVIKPGQAIEVDIKESQLKHEPSASLSNRIIVKADGKLALTGYKKETAEPLFLGQPDLSRVGELKIQPDRCFLNNGFFLKRKFMMTSNAKNFLCASLRDQTRYFDELQDKVIFPEMFPCALLSSALLEKALKWLHDFERNPMVYTSHKICIDRQCLSQLRSNDAVHILIKPAADCAAHDFGDLNATPLDYECYGLVNNNNALVFRALISLVPLELIRKAMA
ncbi:MULTISPECIES: hypothetical protein [Methylomonas]|uniref:N-terminal of MaoC-like dehydratase domain-containing protein n=2 Tax=Methylomonas TaxID=416 RepID=A0A126T4E0_9GAMM|nr:MULTISPECIES: hypothetical protein [Methylomonas]AMK76961.1 hypothetical protein JT25_010755 [Methylomonas denitrificans]OAH97990.1 hypothetical protein A1342_19965 [Methylomonas methanica]TCV81140.1 hypothetical protein EDE11_11628 [Methylomonas methanica]